MKKILFITILFFCLFFDIAATSANMANPAYYTRYAGHDYYVASKIIELDYFKNDIIMMVINAFIELLVFYFLIFRKLNINKKYKYYLGILIINFISWFLSFAYSFKYSLNSIYEIFLREFSSGSGVRGLSIYTTPQLLLFIESVIIMFEGLCFTVLLHKHVKPLTIWLITILVNIITLLLGLFIWNPLFGSI